ncbi:hypothetical protein COJ46_21905 [Bacillus sp. AFS077874]|uniref:hypothetical protein n=1 Tax=unclassified Bacillus (in: firmicutes) TaxID=185979 RepID=UPI000BF4810E|nr:MULTISPECIES: hypothetical protein [unclassified Bacillus (in: firmicutes)]PET71577.1 hypothetical protein CN514_06610 [Bacillus sp. AFS001701]PFM75320.1 hypothetical protein COJ46_21905 [Bacillus sp. AFS077874]
MKKIFLVSIITIFISISAFWGVTNANNNEVMDVSSIKFSSLDKVNNRFYEIFILDLYNKEIMNHIENYYKNKNIKVQGYAAPENEKYVSIRATRNLKGLEEKFSYVLKITIRPEDQDGTIRGLDTLYLAVEPSRINMTNLPKGLTKTKLLKYEHKEVIK